MCNAHLLCTAAGPAESATTVCYVYVPERRQVHAVSEQLLQTGLRRPMQLNQEQQYVPLDHSAVVGLKEDCGFASTVPSVGRFGSIAT